MDTETYNSADDFEAAYAPLKQRVFVQLVKDIEAKREADASGIVNPANRSHKLTVAETMEFHRITYRISSFSCRPLDGGFNGQAWVYDRLRSDVEEYIKNVALKRMQEERGSGLVAEWVDRWDSTKQMILAVSQCFSAHDQLVLNNARRAYLTVRELFTDTFLREVHDRFAPSITEGLKALWARHRSGEAVNTKTIHDAVVIFTDLGRDRPLHNLNLQTAQQVNAEKLRLYLEAVEKPFIAATHDYYRSYSANTIDSGTIAEYLAAAEQAIVQEDQRASLYLHPSTRGFLSSTLHARLISDHIHAIITRATGFPKILSEDSRVDLARLYRLAANAPNPTDSFKSCVDLLFDQFRQEVRQTGAALLTAESKNNADCVAKVVALHERFTACIRECFGGKAEAFLALRGGFEGFINEGNRLAVPLAVFAHNLLSGSSLSQTQAVETIVALYGFFQEKDAFEAEYKRNLAERLLSGRYREADERALIQRLRTQSGHQWSSDLETMFNDITLSKELMERFNATVSTATREEKKTEFKVAVCAATHWPIGVPPACRIPPVLQKYTNDFARVYSAINKGRELTWRMDLGTAVVKMQFDEAGKVVCQLSVTTPMLLILMALTTNPIMTAQEISNETGLHMNYLADHLLSLAIPRGDQGNPVLKAGGAEFKETDKFKINGKFKPPSLRYTVPFVRLYRPAADARNEEANKALLLERSQLVKAAIVRIMKARKEIEVAVLQDEVRRQLAQRFNVERTFIQQQLEKLSEDDLVRRDDEIRTKYHYKA